jgi:hypothetical protein
LSLLASSPLALPLLVLPVHASTDIASPLHLLQSWRLGSCCLPSMSTTPLIATLSKVPPTSFSSQSTGAYSTNRSVNATSVNGASGNCMSVDSASVSGASVNGSIQWWELQQWGGSIKIHTTIKLSNLLSWDGVGELQRQVMVMSSYHQLIHWYINELIWRLQNELIY